MTPRLLLLRSKPARRLLAALTLALSILFAGYPFAAAASGQSRKTAHRIKFAPGQTHIAITGYLSKRHPVSIYTLAGRTGERIKIRLRDLQRDGLVSMYNITFPSGKQFGMKGFDPFDGKLTETGLYRIGVDVNQMASNAASGSFRLDLYLLKRR